MNHDGAATGCTDPAHQLLRAVQTVSRRGEHQHHAAPAPFQGQEILQVRPFLQVLGDPVDRHLLVELGGAVTGGSLTRAGADRPEGVDVAELLAKPCDSGFNAGGDVALRLDCPLDSAQLLRLHIGRDVSALDAEGQRKRIERIEHCHVLGEIQEAAPVVTRQPDVFTDRSMHQEVRLTRERASKASGHSEGWRTAILGQ